MCKSVLPTWVCVPHRCSAYRGQKMGSDHHELELQTVVSYHIGARIQAGSFERVGSALPC